jgi:polyisoprenyl-teichoic acid--peptidoglycan teichoic acid transferase
MSKLFKIAGCFIVSISVTIIMIVGLYLVLPGRTNILILGIDAREDEGALGRTDTMILATIDHLKPNIGILSIPRDLWVNIPGYGENRINTAHFFAESQIPGNGPIAAMEVVEVNFGIEMDYYARIQFESFIELIDIIGGVDIKLENDAAGLSVGEHHLDGEQALAFSRDRLGSDDFFRMERGQQLLKAFLSKIIKLENWQYFPQFIQTLNTSFDTNIPLYLYPRLAIAILRTNADEVDFRVISREMVTPFTTEGGAAVLAPNWELINPLINDVFGQ